MRGVAVLLLLLAAAGCGGDPADDVAIGSPAASPQAVGGCPAEFTADDREPWVPERPTTETDGRLVPDADPVEATICRYGALREEPSQLAGQVVLEQGLDRIRHDLLLPRKLDGQSIACTAAGGPRVPHLLRLRYADGELWVSTTQDVNSCEDTGNGDFVSAVYAGAQVAASYDAQAWVPAPPRRGPCSAGTSGRLGQERTLVPNGWTSVQVCRDDAPPTELPTDEAERVAQILQEVGTTAGTSGCGGQPRTSYSLVFRYPAGPPVTVGFLPGCEPPLSNRSLDAQPTERQVAELEQLLAP